MFYSVRIQIVCVALVAILGYAFPCMGQDTSTIKKNPATGTTVQPTAPTQVPKTSQQTQTPVKPGTTAVKKEPAMIEKRPAAAASKDSARPQTGQSSVTAKTCKGNNDCPTQECWDGFCCDRHCMGRCESCGLPGNEGTCTRVPDGQDPRRSCQISQGGHPACNAACYSGQCMWPDVGTRCGVCAACDGTGRCILTPADDERCGVISCKSLNTGCRTYDDLRGNRCEALGTCKTGNGTNCVWYTDHYSSRDANGDYRECATGRSMNCYKDGIHLVWQDGSVIRYCTTGNVCKTCKPQEP